jgi:transposase InsO family protein
MILFGEHHLRDVLTEIERHHNNHRPHQGLENSIPTDFLYCSNIHPP